MIQIQRRLCLLVASVSVASFGVIGCAPQEKTTTQTLPQQTTTQTLPQQTDAQAPQREPDVIYVPTPQEVVDEMLALAKVTKDDVLYPLRG